MKKPNPFMKMMADKMAMKAGKKPLPKGKMGKKPMMKKSGKY